MILGIDPGSSGGMAYEHQGIIGAFSMSPTEGDVLMSIRNLNSQAGEIKIAVLESQVGVMGPNIRVASSAMFKFGRGYGFLLGVLQALEFRIHLVRPATWQKTLSLGTSKSHASKTLWKSHLKAEAQRLYPMLKVTLKTADALLILEYGRRMRFNAPQMTQEALV